MKWGTRRRAARLIDLALATGWIHMDQKTRQRLMHRWERMAQGESLRPKLPAGLDLSKLPEKAQRAYRAYYGVEE